MKDYNISDLATILQLDPITKDNLIKKYPNYPDSTKEKIIEILWNGVFELMDRLAQLKHEELLVEVQDGKRELTTDLYHQAVKAVRQDFEEILSGRKNESEEIAKIRANLQTPTLPH